ncbi:MAG: hypothetical protein ABI432_19050 [Flavobacteriales bacterium]
MSVARTTFFLSMAFTTVALNAQQRARDNEPRIFGGLSIDIQVPSLGSYTTATASQLPWIGGTLDLGGSLTHRDRWGLAVQGTLALNGYLLWMDTVCFDIYHLTTRAEVGVGGRCR